MVPTIRDYSDSDEDDLNLKPSSSSPRSSVHHHGSPHETRHVRSEMILDPVSAVENPHPVPQSDGHRVKITLRPNSLNHLIHNSDPQPGPSGRHRPQIGSSDRSSLSPPPPLTLRLGLSSARAALARKASYSSSEDDATRSPKQSKKTPRSASSSSKKKIHPPPLSPSARPREIGSISQYRKSYDWLQPSVVGASHHGPPERQHKAGSPSRDSPPLDGDHRASSITDDMDIDKPEYDPMPVLPRKPSATSTTGAPKKRTVRRKGGEPGPGKAWRKGLRKGMPVPWVEGGTFMPDGSISITPGSGAITPKTEGTPEPNQDTESVQADPGPRAPSPPFVPADAETLGFPVLSKPISAPKIRLGTFPKVTTWFYRDNAGDTVFPRREKPREWSFNDRTLVGVGGGKLKYKSWVRGPPSKLTRLLEDEKEAAKDTAKPRPKATTNVSTPNDALTTNGDTGEAADEDVDTRPPFLSHASSESLAFPPVSEPAAGNEDQPEAASEMGEDNESVADLPERTPVAPVTVTPVHPVKKAARPRTSSGKPASRSKPKKSKLAQEILPTDSTSADAIESLM